MAMAVVCCVVLPWGSACSTGSGRVQLKVALGKPDDPCGCAAAVDMGASPASLEVFCFPPRRQRTIGRAFARGVHGNATLGSAGAGALQTRKLPSGLRGAEALVRKDVAGGRGFNQTRTSAAGVVEPPTPPTTPPIAQPGVRFPVCAICFCLIPGL